MRTQTPAPSPNNANFWIPGYDLVVLCWCTAAAILMLAALLPRFRAWLLLHRSHWLAPLGVLLPEGDGAKRFLLCSFCSQEWEFRRILCPTCGEEAEDKLPVYVAEQLPHVRVEACETCKFYLRTVDLTKDGHAVPLVDDLAAIPLSLWASEHAYSRLQPNLLGT